ncbi:GntR family transcriptional regulator [Gryllotalpicola reticulitermitis]|uniref:GntR family transcriptional regulator n=1 Tax=Gryllotalpicola reticulitermitis TaxID=1184153 RepID=A0ABV8QA64_9MICO
MLIRLNDASPATFTEQIVAQVRLGVANGEISRGERLPAARELAASLGVNMHTVLRAYDALRAAGVIDLRRGRGAMVVGGDRPEIGRLFQSVSALVVDARNLGISAVELSSLVKGLAS